MTQEAQFTCDPRLVQIAQAQVTGLLFVSLGRFQGKVQELLDAIRAAGALLAADGTRSAGQAAMDDLFREPDGAHVACVFEPYRREEFPNLYQYMLEQTLTTLVIHMRMLHVDPDWLSSVVPGSEVAVCDLEGLVLVEYARVARRTPSGVLVMENGDIYSPDGTQAYVYSGTASVAGRCLRPPAVHRNV